MRTLLDNWLSEILSEANQPADIIVAYNFGIFESNSGFKLYLIGSKSFDREDDDWVCNEDYIPTNRYLDLPSELASNNWNEVLDLLVGELKSWKTTKSFQHSFLGRAEYLTTGFDDGNLVEI